MSDTEVLGTKSTQELFRALSPAGFITKSQFLEIYSAVSEYFDEQLKERQLDRLQYITHMGRCLKRVLQFSMKPYQYFNADGSLSRDCQGAEMLARQYAIFKRDLQGVNYHVDQIISYHVSKKRGVREIIANSIQYMEQRCLIYDHIYKHNFAYLYLDRLLNTWDERIAQRENHFAGLFNSGWCDKVKEVMREQDIIDSQDDTLLTERKLYLLEGLIRGIQGLSDVLKGTPSLDQLLKEFNAYLGTTFRELKNQGKNMTTVKEDVKKALKANR